MCKFQIEMPASQQFNNGEPFKKSPKKIIGDLIAHEIEKIKGHFYTRFKYCKEFPDLLTGNKMSEQEFEEDVTRIFWINPKTAFALASRLVNEVKRPSPNILPKILGPLIEKIDEVLLTEKEFVQPFIDYIYSNFNDMGKLRILFYWEMPHIPLVLKYIGEQYNKWPILGQYFAKMMLRISSEQLTFYLAQIFQALNYEISDIVEEFLLKYARSSPLFSHQLIWKARCEEKEDDPKEFSKNVKKRKLAAELPMKIMKEMGIEEKKFWDEEDNFFEQITKISSALEPKSEKSVKKEKINSLLQKIKMPSLVYMPTNPNRRVVEIVQGSGKPMQSAARCPVWVSFRCKPFEGPDKYFEKRKQVALQKTNLIDFFDDIDEGITPLMHTMMKDRHFDVKWKSSGIFSTNKKGGQAEKTFEIENTTKGHSRFTDLADEVLPKLRRGTNMKTYVPVKPNEMGMSPISSQLKGRGSITLGFETKKTNQRLRTEDDKDEEIACIFKTHDDIRKDNLSLQVIKMFQEAFRLERLDVYVFPYLTISTRTGNEKILGGIIQVVPNSFSRDQIGKENKYSLFEFFKERYGGEMSPLFQKARENFIKSMAAYSVVSYILQLKDRHNGNIIIDNLGHLIHIDFGFIFDISPGKNMKFENAEFKLTQYFLLNQGNDRHHGRGQASRALQDVRGLHHQGLPRRPEVQRPHLQHRGTAHQSFVGVFP
jgi:phosphatidylinositol 4-kinase